MNSVNETLSALPLHPLLGPDFCGEPHKFDLSYTNNLLWELDVNDQRAFHDLIFSQLKRSGKSYGVAGYLERRDSLLRNLPQMVSEGRLFHLGVDIMVPAGCKLYAPLDSVIRQQSYEPGLGNYGNFVLLEHAVGREKLFSLYGHLASSFPARIGANLSAGTCFAEVGDFNENGNWFHHVHVQLFSAAGIDSGWISKGYCAQSDLPTINQFCPDPQAILRWQSRAAKAA